VEKLAYRVSKAAVATLLDVNGSVTATTESSTNTCA